jgi:hypothetical protein
MEELKVKRSLGRHRHTWKDISNIMYLGEKGRKVMDWLRMSQDRDQEGAVVNTVMNLRVP